MRLASNDYEITMETRVFKLEVNAEQMCRTCLARNVVLETLFCDEIVDGEIVSMTDVYETVFGEQVSR